MNYHRERACATEAVKDACHVAVQVARELVGADTIEKGDRSPVTVADYSVQIVVSARLVETFPDIPIVGEEEASALRDAPELLARVTNAVHRVRPDLDQEAILELLDRGRHRDTDAGQIWALDPIDGTKGFVRGDQYAIALGLIDGGRVALGVLGCPNLRHRWADASSERGVLLVAERGAGAEMAPLVGDQPNSIQVAQVGDISQAAFCESVEAAHSSHGDSARVAELLGIVAEPVRVDSQCKYAILARGDASIYLRLPTRADYREKIWDHAAGSIVVEEAGGTVTDVDGRALDFSRGRTLADNRGIIASSGRFHRQIVDAVGQVIGPAPSAAER